MVFLRSFRSHAAWEGLRTGADHKKRVVMLGRGEPVGTLSTAQREDNEVFAKERADTSKKISYHSRKQVVEGSGSRGAFVMEKSMALTFA